MFQNGLRNARLNSETKDFMATRVCYCRSSPKTLKQQRRHCSHDFAYRCDPRFPVFRVELCTNPKLSDPTRTRIRVGSDKKTKPESGKGSGSDKGSFGSARAGSAPLISEYPERSRPAPKQTEKCRFLLDLCSTLDPKAYEKNCLPRRPLRVRGV